MARVRSVLRKLAPWFDRAQYWGEGATPIPGGGHDRAGTWDRFALPQGWSSSG